MPCNTAGMNNIQKHGWSLVKKFKQKRTKLNILSSSPFEWLSMRHIPSYGALLVQTSNDSPTSPQVSADDNQ